MTARAPGGQRLVVLTDRTQVPDGRTLGDVLRAAAGAGLQTVLLREVDLPDDERARLADEAREAGLEVIAAHRPVPGCRGLHLPSGARPGFAARDTLINSAVASVTRRVRWQAGGAKAGWTPFERPWRRQRAASRRAAGGIDQCFPQWGRSCHSRADLVRAAADGAWWATLSPYAPSESKPGYGPVVPGAAFEHPPLPVFALGGITPENAADARKAGAYGVAVMGAVMRAEDPAGTVAALLRAVP